MHSIHISVCMYVYHLHRCIYNTHTYIVGLLWESTNIHNAWENVWQTVKHCKKCEIILSLRVALQLTVYFFCETAIHTVLYPVAVGRKRVVSDYKLFSNLTYFVSSTMRDGNKDRGYCWIACHYQNRACCLGEHGTARQEETRTLSW